MKSKKIRFWVQAARLRTLSLALSGIILGSLIAASEGSGSWLIFILCILTATLFQVLSNFANDLGDGLRGTDEKRNGEKRMVASGDISPSEMKIAVALLSVLSLISSSLLIFLALKKLPLSWTITFFALAIASIVAARAYTLGKYPYGYIRLGEIMVFLFFGWLAVGGSYTIMTGTWNPKILIAASAVGLFSAGVLNLNNLRDIPTDLRTNKKTIANWLGFRYAKVFQYVLILLAIDCIFIFNWINEYTWWRNLFLLGTPFLLFHFVSVSRLQKPEQADPLLKQLAITTLIISSLWGLGMYLGS